MIIVGVEGHGQSLASACGLGDRGATSYRGGKKVNIFATLWPINDSVYKHYLLEA